MNENGGGAGHIRILCRAVVGLEDSRPKELTEALTKTVRVGAVKHDEKGRVRAFAARFETAPYRGQRVGASTLGLTLLGDYNPLNFVPHTQANGSTLITYTPNGGLDSLLRPVSGAETHAGEFGRGYSSASDAIGHGPGPSS
jgi:hypothetical protein